MEAETIERQAHLPEPRQPERLAAWLITGPAGRVISLMRDSLTVVRLLTAWQWSKLRAAISRD